MIELNNKDFKKISHLVKSRNELSVLSVINGIMPGQIFANSIDNPTAALIKTSECNLIAGSPDDTFFNNEISSKVAFWDQLVPDSSEWINKIPSIHENPFVKKYKRRQYILTINDFVECNITLKEGYTLEKVDLSLLRQTSLENSEKLLEWAENWGSDENFEAYGTGYFIHNYKVIVSWCLTDCSFDRKVAIGIHTDEKYRNNGFGKMVVSETIKDCFSKGYQEIHWLCVDTNKGSIAIAEGLGFTFVNDYYSFTSYPPIENSRDLSELEWYEWGNYLEYASRIEERLIQDCLLSYAKANDVKKTMNILMVMKQKKIHIDYSRFKNYITTMQANGMCSNFTEKELTYLTSINI